MTILTDPDKNDHRAEVPIQPSNGDNRDTLSKHAAVADGATSAAPDTPRSRTRGKGRLHIQKSDSGLLLAFSDMGVEIRRNMRSREVELWLPGDMDWCTDLPGREEWSTMEVDIESRMICEINRRYKVMFGADTWTRCLQSLLASRQEDPILEYVHGGEWDGKPRLDTCLQHVLGVEDGPLAKWALRSVLLAAIDRMHVPGAAHHTTVVLASKREGFGKSAFWRLVCPETLFTDINDLSIPFKELNERVAQAVIVEFSELAGLTGRNLKVVKAMLTSTDDSMRWAYGRTTTHMLRRWVGVGSCNVDATGALPESPSGHRRWLVLEVPRLVKYQTIEAWANENAAQLWYEALELYKSTPTEARTSLHHVPTDLRDLQFENNARYEERHEGVQLTALSLTQTVQDPQKLVDLMILGGMHVPRATSDSVPYEQRMAEALANAVRDKAGQMALSKEIERCGWARRDTSVKGEKGIWWFPPTAV